MFICFRHLWVLIFSSLLLLHSDAANISSYFFAPLEFLFTSSGFKIQRIASYPSLSLTDNWLAHSLCLLLKQGRILSYGGNLQRIFLVSCKYQMTRKILRAVDFSAWQIYLSIHYMAQNQVLYFFVFSSCAYFNLKNKTNYFFTLFTPYFFFLPTFNAGGIQYPSYYMIPYSGKSLTLPPLITTTECSLCPSPEYKRSLPFHSLINSGYFTQSGIRFLGVTVVTLT